MFDYTTTTFIQLVWLIKGFRAHSSHFPQQSCNQKDKYFKGYKYTPRAKVQDVGVQTNNQEDKARDLLPRYTEK